jgi:two-component system LytT family response regulator
MKQYKTLIVDDERLAREELKSVLKDYNEIEIVDEAKNGKEGIELIKKHNPDLIFLDVNMPGMTGFEMLKKLQDIPRVIFVTAYDEYAIKAFEVDALDYILKPIDAKRMDEAMEKLKQRDEQEFESSSSNKIDRKDRALTISDKIFIKDGEKCYYAELADVRVLESDGNYVKVYFNDSRPLVLRSLNSFEDRLDPEHFFRANRKFIINLNWIESVENWFNGGLQAQLKSGEKIEISRRQAIRFKDMLSL